MVGCTSQARTQATVVEDSVKTADVPSFDADYAMRLVNVQCSLGARVPGTEAHRRCADFIVDSLSLIVDSVIEQRAPVTTFDGKKFEIRNIIGEINPMAERRVLLLAHYDCRPWADQDADASRRNQPVMGANDAASGVAVMMALAHALRDTPLPGLGVDLLFTDLEDWGDENNEDSWALGTQYWAIHQHYHSTRPMFGILLDMVGASGAQFRREYFSQRYAQSVVDLVWDEARKAGFGAYFPQEMGAAVTDDHIAVNKAGVPCIDIIDMRSGGFFPQWHTTGDTPSVIDANTLHAVGTVLCHVLASLAVVD